MEESERLVSNGKIKVRFVVVVDGVGAWVYSNEKTAETNAHELTERFPGKQVLLLSPSRQYTRAVGPLSVSAVALDW